MALPYTLTRHEVCVLLGVTLDVVDDVVALHRRHWRKDGTMKTSTARAVADQMAVQRLKDIRANQHHPSQHRNHDVVPTDLGVYCRECQHTLFDWPESWQLAAANSSDDPELRAIAEAKLADHARDHPTAVPEARA